MTSKKVFMCMPDFSGGGAEKVMLMLIRAFVSSHNVTCVVTNDKGPLRSNLPQSCELKNLGCSSAQMALPYLMRLFRLEKPDIVCSTLAYFNIVVGIALLFSGHRPNRIVMREANSPSVTLMSLPNQWIGKLCYRVFYNRTDAVICNANYISAELEGLGINPKLINVIPNPIDTPQIQHMSEQSIELPKFGNMSLPLFVAIGRLTKQKGMDRLINWISEMKSKANLIIMGEGPDQSELVAKINNNNLNEHVVIIDFQKNPFPYMIKADAVLLGSRWEGLPNVVLEALALGKKIIASSECESLVEMNHSGNMSTLIIADGSKSFVDELDKVALSAKDRRTKRKKPLVSTLPDEFQNEKVIAQYGAIIFGE